MFNSFSTPGKVLKHQTGMRANLSAEWGNIEVSLINQRFPWFYNWAVQDHSPFIFGSFYWV